MIPSKSKSETSKLVCLKIGYPRIPWFLHVPTIPFLLHQLSFNIPQPKSPSRSEPRALQVPLALPGRRRPSSGRQLHGGGAHGPLARLAPEFEQLPVALVRQCRGADFSWAFPVGLPTSSGLKRCQKPAIDWTRGTRPPTKMQKWGMVFICFRGTSEKNWNDDWRIMHFDDWIGNIIPQMSELICSFSCWLGESSSENVYV